MLKKILTSNFSLITRENSLMWTKSKLYLMALVAGLGLIGASMVSTTQAATIVFEDHFDNGSVANSDSVPGFWTTITESASTGNGATEAGSLLTLEATGVHPRTSVSSAVSNTFNFFTAPAPMVYTMTGLSLTGNAPSGNQILRMGMLSDGPNRMGDSDDSFGIDLRNDGAVMIRSRINNAGWFTYLDYKGTGATITGAELTLDATNYAVRIFTSTGTIDQNTLNWSALAGPHGMAQADWGTGGTGDSALFLETQVTGGSLSSIANVGDVTVAVPEPATLGLLAVGMSLLVLRGYRHGTAG